jgi:hypothetical protein
MSITDDISQAPGQNQSLLLDLLRVAKLPSASDNSRGQQQQPLRHLARVLDDYSGTMSDLDERLHVLQSYTLQAITVTRKTYPEILKEPGRFRKVVQETLKMMQEGVAEFTAIGFP